MSSAERIEPHEVKLLNDFVTKEECQYMIEHYAAAVTPSPMFGMLYNDTRTSSSTVCYVNDPVVMAITQRVADKCGMPIQNIEGVQFLRYLKGEQYKFHHDYFVCGEPYQRIHTFLVYLNDLGGTEQGGATCFYHYGLRVYPQTGRTLWFRDAHDDGTVIPESLHSGEPVLSETPKYALNIWVQDRAAFSTEERKKERINM